MASISSTHQIPVALPPATVVTTELHYPMIQNGCWSSSHHVHIPGSREERGEEAKGLFINHFLHDSVVNIVRGVRSTGVNKIDPPVFL